MHIVTRYAIACGMAFTVGAASYSAVSGAEFDIHERYNYGGPKIIELTPVAPGTSTKTVTDADGCTQVYRSGVGYVDLNCPRSEITIRRR